jgi:hypothetical protein
VSPSTSSRSTFRSAVTGDDGEVDAGYLALYWTMAVVMGAIPIMCIGAVVAMFITTAHEFKVQDLGVGIGSVCAGLGVAIGAVGAFRAGDKPRLGTIVTTEAATRKQTTETQK